MTSKSKINDIDNNKNSTNIDTEIKEYITGKGFVRRRQLVKYLMDNNPNDRGYSKRTINRKIDQMIKENSIVTLKFNELKNYGIEEIDKRATYLILKETSEIRPHIDRVFTLLESGDGIDKKSALREVDLYKKRYVLSPNQLDVLVMNLSDEDTDFIDYLLRILYNYVIERRVQPNNKIEFIRKLGILLKLYPEPDISHKNLRTHIIHLLGLYDDEAFIEQLKKDAMNLKDIYSVENDYNSEFTAKAIEKHRTELFNFINDLRKEGKEDAAKFINNIRYQAMQLLGMVEDRFAADNPEKW